MVDNISPEANAAPSSAPTAGKTLSTDSTTALLDEIYDMYRMAALNKNYYGEMLARYQLRNTWLEIAIAIGTTSSGVSGGLALLNKSEYGNLVWGVVTAISSLLAIAKPILQLNKQVERYSKLFAGHLENFMNLQLLVTKIRRNRKLTSDMVERFEQAEQRRQHAARGPHLLPGARHVRRHGEEVAEQLVGPVDQVDSHAAPPAAESIGDT